MSESFARLFSGPGARTRVLGELEIEEALYLADPLTGTELALAVEAGRYVVEIATARGRIAAARGLRKGTSFVATELRPAGSLVVDTGKASLSSASVAKLGDVERETFLSDEPEAVGGERPWVHGFTSGWGDGIYDVLLAYEGERAVGVIVDFDVVDVAKAGPASKNERKKLTDAEHTKLFDALEAAVTDGTPIPDLSLIDDQRKRKVHAVLFPRLAALLALDDPPAAVTRLAKTWWRLPGFQQALARTPLPPARWLALLNEGFFAFESALAPELAAAVAEDESIPPRVRFTIGEPVRMWPIAIAALESGDLTFFTRRSVKSAAPDEAARLAVVAAVRRIAENEPKRSRACIVVIENLGGMGNAGVP